MSELFVGYSDILVENHTTPAFSDTNEDQRPAANSSSSEKETHDILYHFKTVPQKQRMEL